MNLEEAKIVLARTHRAAIKRGDRASGMYLVSGPGVGKSDAVVQQCAELARTTGEPVGLVVFMMATISSVDVRGFLLPSKNTATGVVDSTFSTPPWFPTKANTQVFLPDGTFYPEGTWQSEIPAVGTLFLDEFGQAEEDVKKPAAELIYKGRVGNAHLPMGWRVVAAGNRMTDRSGVLRELLFIVNRRCLLSIDPHLPTWLKWANAQPPELRPHYLSISFAQKNPDIVFKDKVPDGTDGYCTPRSLCMLDRDLRSMSDDYDRIPTDDLSRELATGWIGGASASQYFVHLKYADELPELADIERDPAKAKLPDKRDAQMVCAYMLAHNINAANVANMVRYMERLHIEMQVVNMLALVAQQDRAREVLAKAPIMKWLEKNRDLIMAAKS